MPEAKGAVAERLTQEAALLGHVTQDDGPVRFSLAARSAADDTGGRRGDHFAALGRLKKYLTTL